MQSGNPVVFSDEALQLNSRAAAGCQGYVKRITSVIGKRKCWALDTSDCVLVKNIVNAPPAMGHPMIGDIQTAMLFLLNASINSKVITSFAEDVLLELCPSFGVQEGVVCS